MLDGDNNNNHVVIIFLLSYFIYQLIVQKLLSIYRCQVLSSFGSRSEWFHAPESKFLPLFSGPRMLS